MDDCLFCKIISGEIPTTKVYETDDILVFEDAAPESPVHVLVVPKEHHANLGDNMSGELLGKVMEGVVKAAEIKGVTEKGYRCIINTGEHGDQTIKHMHVHVVGGRQLGDHDR